MNIDSSVIAIGLTVIAQIAGAAYAYGKLNQRLDSQKEKLEEFMADQKRHRDDVQDAIEQLWNSMSKRFEKIFDSYLKTSDAERFFKKKGED